jgi:CBS domain-containing protein
VFPLQGPKITASFWSCDTKNLARRFIGLAPRGVTIEYATDQLIEALQESIRRASRERESVAKEAGVPEKAIDELISLYGTDVAYGSTLRDVEAVARSFESQMKLVNINAVTLTGKTPLQDVREALKRLREPEVEFDSRIHLVAASSMLSHGVDIDRLNIMVMLGLPLSTAEFIQTTSRVGRKYPGLIYVLHKMGRERDAGVFRTFPTFIQHADRMIDPIPITGKSRRVLELTFPGILMGRIYGIHEPDSLRNGYGQLTTVSRLREAFTRMGIQPEGELAAIIDLLDVRGALSEKLRNDLERMIANFFRELYNPATRAQFPQQLFANMGPMRSLRDVEEQVPVFSRGGR